MAYTTVPTITTGDVATAAWGNTYIRNNLRYLKGEDGVPTIQNGLIVSNALGTEYLTVPSLTTAQRDALSAVNGMIIYNSTLTVFQRYEAGAWVSFTNLAAMTIASIAQGDIFFRGASVVERLAAGTSGWFLKTQGVGANPIWAVAPVAFTRVGGNTTEASTTSSVDVDVLTVSGLSIAVASQILVKAILRKASGNATAAFVGLKLNTTVVRAGVQWAAGLNEASSGIFFADFVYGVTSYLRAGRLRTRAAPTQTGGDTTFDTDMPTATLTDIIIRLKNDDATTAIYVDEVHVYSYAIS